MSKFNFAKWLNARLARKAAELTRLKRVLMGDTVEDVIAAHRCPDCDWGSFFEGPSGGGGVNVMCANPACGHKFAWYGGVFGFIPISNDTKFYRLGNPRRLVDL